MSMLRKIKVHASENAQLIDLQKHTLPNLIEDRINIYMPFNVTLTAKHKATLHANHPANAPLRVMTLDAAWQFGLDQETGPIEMGKSEDFMILPAP